MSPAVETWCTALFKASSLQCKLLTQHLVAETSRRDHEVEQGDLDCHLWQVVGVAQLGGDVEPELGAVLDGAVAQTDAVNTCRCTAWRCWPC